MVWFVDDGSPEQRDMDQAYCRGQAYRAAGQYRSPPANAYRYGKDYDNPYQPLGEAFRSAGQTMGAVAEYEGYVTRLTNYCMQALGYRLVPVEEPAQTDEL